MALSASSVSSVSSAQASSGLPPVCRLSRRKVRSGSPLRPRTRHSASSSSTSSPLSVSRVARRSPLAKRSHPSPSCDIPPGRHVRTTSTRSALSRRQAKSRARADARSIHCRSSITIATASLSGSEEMRASSSTPTASGSASAGGPPESSSRPASALGELCGRVGRQLLHQAVRQKASASSPLASDDRDALLATEELGNERRLTDPGLSLDQHDLRLTRARGG